VSTIPTRSRTPRFRGDLARSRSCCFSRVATEALSRAYDQCSALRLIEAGRAGGESGMPVGPLAHAMSGDGRDKKLTYSSHAVVTPFSSGRTESLFKWSGAGVTC